MAGKLAPPMRTQEVRGPEKKKKLSPGRSHLFVQAVHGVCGGGAFTESIMVVRHARHVSSILPLGGLVTGSAPGVCTRMCTLNCSCVRHDLC